MHERYRKYKTAAEAAEHAREIRAELEAKTVKLDLRALRSQMDFEDRLRRAERMTVKRRDH